MSEKSADWRGKSVAEKTGAVIDGSHASPMTCLNCGARVMPADMRKHRSRCERPDPHALDAWESERDTVGRGVTHAEITRLVLTGALRWRDREGREFLLRDVEAFLDARRLYGSALSIVAT